MLDNRRYFCMGCFCFFCGLFADLVVVWCIGFGNGVVYQIRKRGGISDLVIGWYIRFGKGVVYR